MKTPIKPLADRVVAVREIPESKTASGLYLPESSQEKSTAAKVVAVGPDVKGIKINDDVIYKEYSATEVKIDNTEYFIVREEDVLATV